MRKGGNLEWEDFVGSTHSYRLDRLIGRADKNKGHRERCPDSYPILHTLESSLFLLKLYARVDTLEAAPKKPCFESICSIAS
jgi:hypothetical protein